MLGANSGKIGYRTKHSGTWNQIKEFLHQLNYTNYTVKKDGTGASGTWGINISGNAATATSAVTSNRTKFLETFKQGSTTETYGTSYPIWAQWSNNTNVRLKCTDYTVWTDKADYATTSTYATNSTYLYASDSPYRYGDSHPYYMKMRYNVNNDNRWYLSAYPETPKTVAVDYSYTSGNASSATKLTSSAGSATLPIYFSDGKPVACTASSVFSNLSNSGNNISVTVAG